MNKFSHTNPISGPSDSCSGRGAWQCGGGLCPGKGLSLELSERTPVMSLPLPKWLRKVKLCGASIPGTLPPPPPHVTHCFANGELCSRLA